MTSGRPPDAPVPRRAGLFVPPAVDSALSLPFWLVFVGTVLLSVVLSSGTRRRSGPDLDRRRPASRASLVPP
jgi:hypothetical protein